MRNILLPVAVLSLCLVALAPASEPSPDKWEKAIAKFEEQDRDMPPAPEGIVFVGSSTIRLWDLSKQFSDLPCANRGFGGSHIADSVHFAERIIIPYRPRIVVVGAGGNDINSGKTPEQVAADFQALVAKIHAALPATKIFYVSLFPSVARQKIDDQLRDVNRRIEAFTRTDPRLGFIDTRTRLTAPGGGPRPELLRKDNLHLNDDGYAVWNEVVGPVVHAAYEKSAAVGAAQ